MTAGSADRLDLMKAFLQAFNDHDLDTIMSSFTDDCEFDSPRGSSPFGHQFRGKDEVRKGLAARFTGIPDAHYGDDLHWHCEERGVSEWTLTGTTTEGEKIEVRGCDLFVFSGDKIKRKDSFWKIVE